MQEHPGEAGGGGPASKSKDGRAIPLAWLGAAVGGLVGFCCLSFFLFPSRSQRLQNLDHVPSCSLPFPVSCKGSALADKLASAKYSCVAGSSSSEADSAVPASKSKDGRAIPFAWLGAAVASLVGFCCLSFFQCPSRSQRLRDLERDRSWSKPIGVSSEGCAGEGTESRQ